MGDAAGSTARTGSRVSQPAPVGDIAGHKHYQNNSYQHFIHMPYAGFLM
jgi:hypothetical protein